MTIGIIISGQTNIDGYFDALTIGLTDGADNYQLYRWEESLDWNGTIGNWVDILNGPNENNSTLENEGFIVGKGYDIFYKTANKTLVLTGIPYTSNQSINITKTSNSTSPGWNLIGNPFYSTIVANSSPDDNNFLSSNANVLNPIYSGIYLWDEKASFQGNRY
ncbi:MAG: hypothetical protein JEY97_01215 [Bacteroidales bacterium]|nr:hypothetical protein [Bacteroidales bacterium]